MNPRFRSANHRQSVWTLRWRLGVLGVYWLILAIATHLPTTALGPPSDNHLDKLAHCVAYAVLTWLMAWARMPRPGLAWQWLIGIWIVAAAYAGLDELLQAPVGRRSDMFDWLADLVGAAIGLAAYRWWFRCSSDQV